MGLLVSGCGQRKETQTLSGKLTVVPGRSNVNFTSIKNQDLTVTGYFSHLTGTITLPSSGKIGKGSGRLTLDLASLETGLDIRNKRVLKYFFETKENKGYSRAIFTIDSMKLSGEPKQIKDLNKQRTLHASGTMKLHGQSVDQTITLLVTRTGPGTIKATTKKPYIFKIEKFNMMKPLKEMMEVCGHDDVSLSVPLTFNITLEEV